MFHNFYNLSIIYHYHHVCIVFLPSTPMAILNPLVWKRDIKLFTYLIGFSILCGCDVFLSSAPMAILDPLVWK